MTSTDPKALNVFLQDVATTSKRIIDRARVVAAEQAEPKESTEREQIQLVAADESTIITFEIPTGPPPENLEITGEGSESFDPILVREFLQKRWEYFESFPKNLQKALEAKDLGKVNKVLGKMECEDAEEVVRKLQEGGMLAFESEEIVDRTGKTEEKIIITD